MEKVLIITYYWPPAAGAGVHRWLRMSRFFAENGYEPVIYCPQDAAWPHVDPELNDQVPAQIEVIRRPIFEPAKFLNSKINPNKGSGFTYSKKQSFLQKLIISLRGNFFIPDARMFWIRPSTRFLKNYLREHPEIKAVISTGPPHSMHVIARNLKRKLNIPWIADFRDPWTGIDFYKELNIGELADKRQKKLEHSVLTEADRVVTVSENCAKELSEISGREVDVITNGFIFDIQHDPDTDKTFSIAHFGSLPTSRNPEVLWRTLGKLVKQNSDFAKSLCIKLYGTVDQGVLTSIEKEELTSYVQLHSTVPHAQSLQLQGKAQQLLLVVNNSGNTAGTLTGKIFEYLNSGRPILAIGPSGGNLEKLIRQTDSGTFTGYSDDRSLEKILLENYALYLKGALRAEPKNLDAFSSEALAKRYCKLVEDILNKD